MRDVNTPRSEAPMITNITGQCAVGLSTQNEICQNTCDRVKKLQEVKRWETSVNTATRFTWVTLNFPNRLYMHLTIATEGQLSKCFHRCSIYSTYVFIFEAQRCNFDNSLTTDIWYWRTFLLLISKILGRHLIILRVVLPSQWFGVNIP